MTAGRFDTQKTIQTGKLKSFQSWKYVQYTDDPDVSDPWRLYSLNTNKKKVFSKKNNLLPKQME
jgi:hypothetical protein